MSSQTRGKADRSLIVPIVGDAAIAGPVADGRLLPVLIIDTRQRPEIAELIRVHQHLPGDATSQWASSRDDHDLIVLLLAFDRPMKVSLILEFSIEHQAVLVECILRGGGVYMQSGVPGDRLTTTMHRSRMLVEVPDSGFGPHWERLFLKRMTVVMARRMGVSRKRARPAAQTLIGELKRLASFRIRQA